MDDQALHANMLKNLYISICFISSPTGCGVWFVSVVSGENSKAFWQISGGKCEVVSCHKQKLGKKNPVAQPCSHIRPIFQFQ